MRLGINETKKALEKAIADAVTPEVVAGFVDSAMRALTDKDLTARILEETHVASDSKQP